MSLRWRRERKVRFARLPTPGVHTGGKNILPMGRKKGKGDGGRGVERRNVGLAHRIPHGEGRKSEQHSYSRTSGGGRKFG